MKRLAVSLVFAAVILVPAMSFGQETQPAAPKHEDCLSKCTQFAQMACHGALKGHQNRCIRRAESKCVKQCMRGLVAGQRRRRDARAAPAARSEMKEAAN
ncbi:MAG: hypothetical protein WA268_19930 [Xanthobacteraceae bacterium]